MTRLQSVENPADNSVASPSQKLKGLRARCSRTRVELLVSAWLLGIVINLLIIPGFFDIALRDFGLSLGALALGRLARNSARKQFRPFELY